MQRVFRWGLIALIFAAVPALLPSALAAGGAVQELVRILRDPAQSGNAKGEACQRLMDLGPAAAPAVPALIELLKAKDPLMRDYAVTTLSGIGPAAGPAVPALKRIMAADGDADIRQLAAGALARIQAPGTAANVPAPGAAAAVRPVSAANDAAFGRQSAGMVRSPAARPVLELRQGRNFRWSMPAGWHAEETISGVDLASPDGRTGASSVILLRSPGSANPRDFTLHMLPRVPGFSDLRLISARGLPNQPSGIPGLPWTVAELELAYRYHGVPTRGTWVCGTANLYGYSFDAFLLGYQAPANRFDQDRLWLWEVARSIAVTDAGQVAGNNTLIPPRNHPLDNSALIESWRLKGLSEDRISQARREGTMGYTRQKDPETGRMYEMPLEAYDGTVGGYRNPVRPTEILQHAAPGE